MNSEFELIVLQERVADMARFAEQHRIARASRAPSGIASGSARGGV